MGRIRCYGAIYLKKERPWVKFVLLSVLEYE